MTQIQLIDLCSRVPYHPKGHVVNACNGAECDEWLTCVTFPMFTSVINNCRLYLRPMSSMTEEEEIEYDATFATIKNADGHYDSTMTYKSFDFFNAHHFDYRNLIGRGLAIEAPEGMYNLNEK